MSRKVARISAAVAGSFAMALSMAACGGGGSADAGEKCSSIEADLQKAVTTINDWNTEQGGTLPEIMLASDVQSPTQKYGLWVVPYTPTDAVKKFISKTPISDGKYEFQATTTDGVVCVVDQDGTISLGEESK
jgi:hypothetical protein